MKYDELGRELPDPTRIEAPVEFKRPETLEEKIARAVYTLEWRKRVQAQGYETAEEADDFDVADDVELPTTQYELSAMQEDSQMVQRTTPSKEAPLPAATPPEPAGGGSPPPPKESTVPTT